ncbi:MAG: DUF5685 family protein [Wujia sp.]
MFGYVTINKPELKVKEYDRYRAYYCGVCHALKEEQGMFAQVSLTYDATFAAVLLTALYEPKTRKKSGRCMIHPAGKKNFLENAAISYVADMNLVLAYYKCLDDWEDEKKFTKLLYSRTIRKRVNAIGKKYGKKLAHIRDCLRTLADYEKQDSKNLDNLAGTFGEIMGEILAYYPGHGEDWSEELRQFGYQLGKFIYILDAYDDVTEDIKRNRFNPLALRYKRDTADEFSVYIKEILMMIATDMAKKYERLPIVQETGILRNVIYSGIWTRYFSIEKREKDKEHEGSL